MFENQDRPARNANRYKQLWRRVGLLVAALAWLGEPVLASMANEQTPAEEKAEAVDPWAPLRLLEGSWEGAINGKLGRGKGVRRFSFILDGKFVLLRHASVRLPQEKSPRGDYHRELGVFSFDRERTKLIYREFLVEGYVNRYTCDVEPKRLLCTTESVENGPGMRARYTLEISDRYRFDEIFELASPGGELEVYFTNRWTRMPNLEE